MGFPPGPWSPVAADMARAENCLNLNVWTTGPGRHDLQPVLVWLHPGRHMVGGTMPTVDPWALAARHNLVVVTCNYRLGPWGWLHLGLLDSNYEDCVNVGVQDQIQVLRWVRDHIEAFGGDPGNITLFGMSTGASDVATLLGTPRAKGLFHRAAMYSGHAENALNRSEAAAFARRFLQVAADFGTDSADMKAVSNVDLRHLHLRVLASGPVSYEPVVDGELLPRPPDVTIAAGLSADIPLLLSVTSAEAGILDLTGAHAVDQKYAALFDSNDAVDHNAKIMALSRQMYYEPAERLAAAVQSGGGRCWVQVFDYHPSNSHLAGNSAVSGQAVHAADTAALFCDIEGEDGSETDRMVARREQNALVSLARFGEPGWGPYTMKEPQANWITPTSLNGACLKPLPGMP